MQRETSTPVLQLTKLNPRATVPSYQTAGAAGLDIAACLETDETTITLEPGARTAVPTGLAVAIPDGYEGQ
ncbi:MAG: dUTP diphosphatase, partial [Planctomycetota bacterium]